MARIDLDPIKGHPSDLAEGERLVTEFRPDPQTFWGAHLVVAVILGLGAGLLLFWLQYPHPVVGPVGAVVAVAVRAGIVQSQAMAQVWRLTDRRLIGPKGQATPLAQLLTARPFPGGVQITTTSGARHLMKYQADPAAVAFLLLTAAGRKPRHG